MPIREKIAISLFLLFLLIAFINGFFIDKTDFKEQINGIVLNKTTGSKGSVILNLKRKPMNDSIRYSFGGRQIYEKIKIGDSIVKPSNTYSLYLFKNFNSKYLLVDSMEIYHGLLSKF